MSGESEWPIGLPATPKMRVAGPAGPAVEVEQRVRAHLAWGGFFSIFGGRKGKGRSSARSQDTAQQALLAMAMPTTCAESDRSSMSLSTARLSASERAVETTFTKSGSKASIGSAACSSPWCA